MTISIFNPCFLITTTGTLFGIVSMQTNNTIILGDDQFLAFKEDKLVKVNLIVKPKEKLNLIILLLLIDTSFPQIRTLLFCAKRVKIKRLILLILIL